MIAADGRISGRKGFPWVWYEKALREFNLIAVILEIKQKDLAWQAFSKHSRFLKTHICGYWPVLLKRPDSEASCHWGSRAGRLPLIPGLSETEAQVQTLRVDCLRIKNPWTIPVSQNFWDLFWIRTKLSFEYRKLMI